MWRPSVLPVKPPIPGADLLQVFTVSSLHSARDIKETISRGKVGRAVVIISRFLLDTLAAF